MTTLMYRGYVSSTMSHKLYQTGLHPSRMEAAGECFRNRPKATTCSTTTASVCDMRWITRGEWEEWGNERFRQKRMWKDSVAKETKPNQKLEAMAQAYRANKGDKPL